MLIAQQKRNENIAEYILYMWQIEDIIRSFNLSMTEIEAKIVSQYKVDESTRVKIKDWYQEIINDMRENGVVNEGHTKMTLSVLGELNFLHTGLMENKKETDYHSAFEKIEVYVNELREKALRKNKNDIEICFDGLYSYLLLKLKNKKINEETSLAFREISQFIAILAAKYKKAFTTN